ncbi:MAG: hypothetical protein JRI93_03605 [Deltaproteobacteria bacterium]|nr:hypothetical protein [Deltaproteobacteria bacterium]
MDFRLTKEEASKKEAFETFFESEMKNAPPQFGSGGLEGVYDTEEGFALRPGDITAPRGWMHLP